MSPGRRGALACPSQPVAVPRVTCPPVCPLQTRKEAGQKWTWWVWDGYVKAIRDLQVDQEQMGRPATKPIRENPTVAQMADNLQRDIHNYRKRCACSGPSSRFEGGLGRQGG